MRVAVYGGSFDPPHVAHLLVAAYVLAVGDFERLLVLPVFEHAFGKKLLSFAERVELCRLCFRELPAVSVLELEADLPRPNYTERTLARIKELHPDYELRLIVGSDVLDDLADWHDFERVKELAPPFVVTRVGHERPELGPAVLPEVSSSRIRDLVARSAEPDARRDLECLVPAPVLARMRERGLYGA